jgi:hypothetical protein
MFAFLFFFQFPTFIRIHWYIVPATFRYTVREDEFDYIFFSSNEYNRQDTTIYALDIDKHFTFYYVRFFVGKTVSRIFFSAKTNPVLSVDL